MLRSILKPTTFRHEMPVMLSKNSLMKFIEWEAGALTLDVDPEHLVKISSYQNCIPILYWLVSFVSSFIYIFILWENFLHFSIWFFSPLFSIFRNILHILVYFIYFICLLFFSSFCVILLLFPLISIFWVFLILYHYFEYTKRKKNLI